MEIIDTPRHVGDSSEAAPIPLLRSALLDTVPGIVHGFSTREGGVSTGPIASLNLSRGIEDIELVRENRRRFAAAFGRPVDALVFAEQRHGNSVAIANKGDARPAGGHWHPGVDALISDRPDLLLIILAADCLPILIATDDGRVVAAVHAGWRGTAANVARHAVAALQREYGVAPERLVAAIGPSIGPCCYEVDGPVIDAFGAGHEALLPGRPDHAMLDLRLANVRQLEGAGLRPERIEVLDYCTSCRTDLLYSHRREGEPSGRFAGAITIDA